MILEDLLVRLSGDTLSKFQPLIAALQRLIGRDRPSGRTVNLPPGYGTTQNFDMDNLCMRPRIFTKDDPINKER